MNRRLFTASAVVALGAAGLGSAGAQEQNVRLKGTITSFSGQVLTVDAAAMGPAKIVMADKFRVNLVEPIPITKIGVGDFIGSGAVPQPNGMQLAVEVHVFAESLRGTGEGFRPWSGVASGTMTNATVREISSAQLEGISGRVLTLKYAGGEQRLFIPPTTPIVRLSPGDRGALVPGAHVTINAVRSADGGLSAASVNVGKDGFVPPV